MKRFGYILILILTTYFTADAQPQGRRDRIHAVKKDYITDKIHLTPEQAARFWPLYNRYEHDLGSVRREFSQKYPREHTGRDEASSRRFIEDNLEFKEERLHLEKRYKNEFLKVLSAQQLAELYEAERDFKRILIRQLNEQRDNRGNNRRIPPGHQRRR